MTVIDLATVKTNLGLSVSTYDTQITATIPIIDAKVKQICNNKFHNQIVLSTTSGSPYAEISALYYWWGGQCSRKDRSDPLVKQILQDIPIGTYLEGESIPRTSILEAFYDWPAEFDGTSYTSPFVKMAADATSTSSGAQGFYGWNKAYDSVVSKGIWYLISQNSTNIDDNTWRSKSFGPLSVTKGDGGGIDGTSGMPLWFVRGLPRYH